MNLQARVRRWLGIFDTRQEILDLRLELHGLRDVLVEPLNNISAVLLAEDSDARKALSSILGDRATAKMIAEARARAHTTGEE